MYVDGVGIRHHHTWRIIVREYKVNCVWEGEFWGNTLEIKFFILLIILRGRQIKVYHSKKKILFLKNCFLKQALTVFYWEPGGFQWPLQQAPIWPPLSKQEQCHLPTLCMESCVYTLVYKGMKTRWHAILSSLSLKIQVDTQVFEIRSLAHSQIKLFHWCKRGERHVYQISYMWSDKN